MESLEMFAYSRTCVLIALQNIHENKWDNQPNDFPNTIRWNAGHMYMTTEVFLNKADPNYTIMYPQWKKLFINGTRSSEWIDEPPSKEKIISALDEQKKRILTTYSPDDLKKEAAEIQVFHALSLHTVEATLQFITWHDGLHLGIFKLMDKVC
ncbi:MAG TPA: DinB family protein [Cerasibacillus sp.]|uniref:DinB family protein n=1 Tax=Cerasibacillus sp. TaxID=2498711 RepID=UPI002F407CBB